MEIRNVAPFALAVLASGLKMEMVNQRSVEHKKAGDGHAFVLRPLNKECKYRRLSHTGRRVHAICWHGHREFMQKVFANYPTATIITCMARYNGAEDFERKFEDTAYQNIGSMVQPMHYANACDCGEGLPQ